LFLVTQIYPKAVQPCLETTFPVVPYLMGKNSILINGPVNQHPIIGLVPTKVLHHMVYSPIRIMGQLSNQQECMHGEQKCISGTMLEETQSVKQLREICKRRQKVNQKNSFDLNEVKKEETVIVNVVSQETKNGDVEETYLTMMKSLMSELDMEYVEVDIPIKRKETFDSAILNNNFEIDSDLFFVPNGKYVKLSTMAKKILKLPNAGGNSKESEALSAQILRKQFDAKGLTSEMEIQYWSENWKKCDYKTTIDNITVAVSVTRLVPFRINMISPNEKLTGIILSSKERLKNQVVKLYEKKLYGLVIARSGMLNIPDFMVSILHILCRTNDEVDMLNEVYNELSDELKSDIIVLISKVSGNNINKMFS
jgi:hypothetical protein